MTRTRLAGLALSGMAALALAGCALPVPVMLVSTIAGGVSFVSTGKSLQDHALSAALDQDCAVWRVVRGEPACMPDVQGRRLQVAAAFLEEPAFAEGRVVAAAPDVTVERAALPPPVAGDAPAALPAAALPAPSAGLAAVPLPPRRERGLVAEVPLPGSKPLPTQVAEPPLPVSRPSGLAV